MTVLEALTKLQALRGRLLFNVNVIDNVIQYHAKHQWRDGVDAIRRMTEDQAGHSEPVPYELRSLLEYAVDAVDKQDKLTESFPRLHRDNLARVLSDNHPAWNTELQGIISQLGTGSLFVLLGDRGRGKTQLATGVARFIAETKNLKSQYRVLGDLFTEIKGTFKSGSEESEDSILDIMSSAPLLVLDECDEISGTDWQGQILTRLIDARYREKRSTILITHDAEQAFIAKVGPSIADRLAECGYFISFQWESFRRAPK